MPEVNYSLIAEVLQSIRNNPEHHDQSTWIGVRADTKEDLDQFVISHKSLNRQDLLVAEGSCRTSACIAGWTLLLEGYKAHDPYSSSGYGNDTYYEEFSAPKGHIVDVFSIVEEAAHLLGIGEGADQIFMDMDSKRAVAQLMFVYEKGRLPEVKAYDDENEPVEDFDPAEDMDHYDRYVFDGQESEEFCDEWYARFWKTFPALKGQEEWLTGI